MQVIVKEHYTCAATLLLAVLVDEPTWYSSSVHKQAHAYFCFKSMEERLSNNRKYSDKSYASTVPTSSKIICQRNKS